MWEICYTRNITIFKNLCLLKVINEENRMLSFGFVLLYFMLLWYETYTVPINKTFQNSAAKTWKQVPSVCFWAYVAEFEEIIICVVTFHYMKPLVFYGAFIFPIHILYVSHTPFLSFESNSLSVTAVKLCVYKNISVKFKIVTTQF